MLPGRGPVLLCIVIGPVFSCLRRSEMTDAERVAVSQGGEPARHDEGSMSSQRPPPKPVPRVALAKKLATDKSSLSATAVADKLMPAIKRCYATLLAKKPAAKGAVTVSFTVNAVGKVEGATTDAFDPAMVSCVAPALTATRFPIPMSDYGEPRTARFTL